MTDLPGLLAGSVMLRPYVFVFLLAYLFAAVSRMGWARTATFTAIAWAVAYAADRLNKVQTWTIRAYLTLVFGAVVLLLVVLTVWH